MSQLVEVKPFRGLLYSGKNVKGFDNVVAPPYDVISEKEQGEYYKLDERNVIRLVLGKKFANDSEKNNRYTRSAEFLEKWIADGTLKIDEKPAFYLYEQYFCIKENVCFHRKGLISLVKLEDAEGGNILGHEKTHSEPKRDRFALMDACNAQFSQIFCVYPDGDKIKNILEEESKKPAFLEAKNGTGIVNRLWRIDNEKAIQDIKDEMMGKKLFIADGHHRYITALAFRDVKKTESTAYTMMYMVDEKDYGLRILPFHRIIYGLKGFSKEEFLEKLNENFVVEAKNREEAIDDLGKRSGHLFGLYLGKDEYYLLTLKEGALEKIDEAFTKELRELDVVILQELIIKKLLGLSKEQIKHLENLKYSMKLDEAIEDHAEGELLFILNPTMIDQVKEVALTGQKMPQKSTCFYPKISSGLVMRKID